MQWSFLRAVVGSIVGGGWLMAHAQSTPGAEWACWYAGGHQINCVMLQAADGGPAGVLDPALSVGRSRMPAAVREIQRGGAELYGEVVRIPLLGEPYDQALVQQLARSTVCGATAACRMSYSRHPPDLALPALAPPL